MPFIRQDQWQLMKQEKMHTLEHIQQLLDANNRVYTVICEAFFLYSESQQQYQPMIPFCLREFKRFLAWLGDSTSFQRRDNFDEEPSFNMAVRTEVENLENIAKLR